MSKLAKLIKTTLYFIRYKVQYGNRLKFHYKNSIEGKLAINMKNNSKISIGKHLMTRGPLYLRTFDNGNIEIGNDVFFNHNASITSCVNISIGDNSMFGNNLVIVDHDHTNISTSRNSFIKKSTTIGKNVWVGANCTITSGVNIGNNAIIAANSVVTKDIPPNETWGGCPAKKISNHKNANIINTIPKTIHYCWFGGKKLPRTVKKCIKSWRKYCPDYQIIQWDETNFDINSNTFIKDAYNNKAWAFVSDYARLKIIYENGGIYLDTDVELLKPLDCLLNETCYLPVEQNNNTVATGLGFGATKHHPLIKSLIKYYDNIAFDKNNLEKIACPIITSRFLKNHAITWSQNKITKNADFKCAIYPPTYFDPVAPGHTKNLLSDKSFSIHHYNATWTPTSNQAKRRIFNILGQERINKIKTIVQRSKIL